MNGQRERDLVELVSPDGSPIGSVTVAHAHTAPGRLHRAYSVLLFDEAGRTLLQQRSAAKSRFPLRWANSCCGHPAPGQSIVTAAARRLSEEMGVDGLAMVEAGVYAYTALDPATGRMEREYDHVLVGRVTGALTVSPDPAEVAQTRWASARDLLSSVAREPTSEYVPWLAGVLNVAIHSPLLLDLL